jgi:hypothetical protein
VTAHLVGLEVKRTMMGDELLDTLHSLPPQTHAAAFLRHAERHKILDASDPTLAEITEAGAAAAERLGARLTGFGCVRLFHSPVKRCRQTAECIARGLASRGVPAELVGPEDALGIDYILDLKEAGRLTVLHGDHFVRLWFTGQVSEQVIERAEKIAAYKIDHLVRRLEEPCSIGRRLDLHVSHDWNIIVLRELLVGVRHEEAAWLNFLDGVVFTPQGQGLRAMYRDRNVEVPLPWPGLAR